MVNSSTNIFFVPVQDRFLIYAPLQQFTALVNARALQSVRASLQTGATAPAAVRPVVEQLQLPGAQPPAARTGPLDDPLFLGIIPTRGCNMACRYCDFAAPKQTSPVMDLNLARDAVDAYLNLLSAAGSRRADVHFFGGEPFFAETVVHFVVAYAAQKAAELGLTVRFEAITNGLYSATRCQWIADHFDVIVLSLDGLDDTQDRHRPALNGRGTFNVVARNARILSEGQAELIVRACVTHDSAVHLPEFAWWISQELRPSTVCFETLVASPLAQVAGLTPPDPWEFAGYFDRAARLLAAHGIETVLSTADLRASRATFCPVGQDALIVSPDGAVDACYLLKEDWEHGGLNMRLGWLRDHEFDLDLEVVQRVRDLAVRRRPLCADCLCCYHCAGGCHVSHATFCAPGQFDDTCIQTRLITIARLLRQINQHTLADAWLADRSALETSAWQRSDRLTDERIVS